MKWFYFYFSLSNLLFSLRTNAQAIDNTASFKNISSDHYFRINYENDFFTGTDRDYTQGIYLEKVKPSFQKFPFTKLLWHPRNSSIIYGLAIEDDGYTPNLIDKANIQYGDRPYAGVLYLKTFLTATNYERHERISTLLSTGIIGPGAGGEGMQKAIHHWIHYTQPLGWHNQISNDAVLNYQVNYERELIKYNNNFSFTGYGSARLGTLSTKASAGVSIMAGKFNNAFTSYTGKTGYKFQWYVYDQPLANGVGYDATLQGGLFNHTSPYTISSTNINRFTFQNKLGVVIIFKHWYIEYAQTSLTKEFSTSINHRTGGLQLGFWILNFAFKKITLEVFYVLSCISFCGLCCVTHLYALFIRQQSSFLPGGFKCTDVLFLIRISFHPFKYPVFIFIQ